jgi:hypothetical protein
MTAKDFLHKKLQPLSDKFGIVFSYQFDRRSEMHLVAVTPVEAYNDPKYGELEFNVTREFDRLFCPECILFVADNDILARVDTPEFIIMPEEMFKSPTAVKIKWECDCDVHEHEFSYALAA